MGRSRVLECLEGLLDRRESGAGGAFGPADQLSDNALATDVGWASRAQGPGFREAMADRLDLATEHTGAKEIGVSSYYQAVIM
jgi:hypothetical protein